MKFCRLWPGFGSENRSLVPGFRCILEPTIMSAEHLLERVGRPLCILGEGLKYYGRQLSGEEIVHLDREYWYPRASDVHRCGWLRAQQGLFTPPEQLIPHYLRLPDAVERWEELHGKD